MQHVALSLYRFERPTAAFWVIGQMVLSRLALRRVPGLSFFKLCGSGTGEGFTPRPNWSVWAILTVWESEAQARHALDTAGVFARWRTRAAETWTVHLQPYSSRGHWAGVAPFAPVADHSPHGPLAALTRATLRPSRALRFWARVPDVSLGVGSNRDVVFKIGIGEVPLLHQVTFSIWPDAARMNAFARSGAHAAAIKAVRDEDWFAEELYARFRVTGSDGTWHARNPLATLHEVAS